ncbi:alpha/beta fold hydrolase [Vibrio alginolyticus]
MVIRRRRSCGRTWRRSSRPRIRSSRRICAGYGDSAKPRGERYSKREMAADQVLAMRTLGFERFAVVGHDRGGRVGHRMAHQRIRRRATALAVLKIVPTPSGT